jgi:hypothetical protein
MNTDPAVEKYLSRYGLLGLGGAPFTPAEVASFERHLGLPLPAAYRAYLLLAGQWPPAALAGSHCHGRHLYTIRDAAEKLLRECGNPFDLPANAIVFWMHQGYQFEYFLADGAEDPETFYYFEGKKTADRHSSFSMWVQVCAVGG